MSVNSNIEWTNATWNPIRGCSRVSPGCQHCYAEAVAARFSGKGQAYAGLTRTANGHPQWTGEVRFIEKHLHDPLKWKEPRRIFVNSMSDLFHENCHPQWIDRIFAVMALAPQHTFQILTKRPQRMLDYFAKAVQLQLEDGKQMPGERKDLVQAEAYDIAGEQLSGLLRFSDQEVFDRTSKWPLPNAWLGVSCENQETANERIPLLLDTPAAVRWISAEPLLGPIDLTSIPAGGVCGSGHSLLGTHCAARSLDWVVIGGESGPGARPCSANWIRSLIDQCVRANVACFVKQLGADPVFDRDETKLFFRDHKGGDPAEWPADLRLRRYPELRQPERTAAALART